MKKRFRQFHNAVTAKVYPEDLTFLRKALTKQEQVLFYRMRTVDQRHGLDTAYHLLKNTHHVSWVNKNAIVKLALFHDIGKAAMLFPLWGRVLAVLVKQISSRLYGTFAEWGRPEKAWKLFRVFYVSKHHPELGGQMLDDMGLDGGISKLVRLHHEPPSVNEPRELPLLRESDQDIYG